MITKFTDRRPTLSALLIVALFTLIPGSFMLLVSLFSGGEENGAGLVFVYAMVLQLILWLKVERPILIMLPFIMALIGFMVSEVVYTVSAGANPIGQGPSLLVYLFSAAVVSLFGTVAAASVGGLLLYAVIVILRKLRELIASR